MSKYGEERATNLKFYNQQMYLLKIQTTFFFLSNIPKKKKKLKELAECGSLRLQPSWASGFQCQRQRPLGGWPGLEEAQLFGGQYSQKVPWSETVTEEGGTLPGMKSGTSESHLMYWRGTLVNPTSTEICRARTLFVPHLHFGEPWPEVL